MPRKVIRIQREAKQIAKKLGHTPSNFANTNPNLATFTCSLCGMTGFVTADGYSGALITESCNVYEEANKIVADNLVAAKTANDEANQLRKDVQRLEQENVTFKNVAVTLLSAAKQAVGPLSIYTTRYTDEEVSGLAQSALESIKRAVTLTKDPAINLPLAQYIDRTRMRQKDLDGIFDALQE